ncbi:hypothetical protein [Sutcliffiella deserti]|uniref:hypothetical protein n=1 Tax=Sutcliffiella deserti TaxID=2875501 RepID=UPI001CBD456E|nr:hypothetical protein [Sutcliffiella deserti]
MEFDYQLSGTGWARGYLKINNKKFNFIASYLTDALNDLLKSLLIITPKCVPYPQKKSSFIMEQEPERTVWKFETQDDKNVFITIVNKNEAVVFQEQCLLDDLLTVVVKSISKLLKKHGIKGYKKSWVNYEFPLDEYQRLHNYINKAD